MTLLVKFEAYLLAEKRVSPNTLAAYRTDLLQFQDFLARDARTLETATIQDVKFFLAFLKKNRATARSMARKISALKSFYLFAHERYDKENIMLDFSAPKIEQKLPNIISESEIAQLFLASEADVSPQGQRNKILLYLLYVTGMRISELIQTKTDDIYFDTGFIKVCGKGNKQRLIPLPSYMLDLLRNYIQTLPANETQTYLFCSMYGGKIQPLSRQACWKIIKNMWQKTGIDRSISPHVLRHSLATHMLANGVDLRSLQLLLGHENLATVQIYTHVDVKHLREIYDKKHPRS